METVWAYYQFDRHLRLLLFDAISRIEIALREKLATYFPGQTHWATRHTENTASKIFFMYSTSTAQANCIFFTDSFSFVSFLYRLKELITKRIAREKFSAAFAARF
ncbi:MAG: Abi family protein [Akkermansia sp.]|nr:Abi family protein [Akkermansia sp.]